MFKTATRQSYPANCLSKYSKSARNGRKSTAQEKAGSSPTRSATEFSAENADIIFAVNILPPEQSMKRLSGYAVPSTLLEKPSVMHSKSPKVSYVKKRHPFSDSRFSMNPYFRKKSQKSVSLRTTRWFSYFVMGLAEKWRGRIPPAGKAGRRK